MIVRLLDPTLFRGHRRGIPKAKCHDSGEINTVSAADAFIAAKASRAPLVRRAYEELEAQTDRMFAVLVDPSGPYQFAVVDTALETPYDGAEELISSVLESRTLQVTRSPADRTHPFLDCGMGGSYFRFRAVHDLLGHAATGYGFDREGEYQAWVIQYSYYLGLARWAAGTELHGEISVLWTTGQFAEHKAALLDPDVILPRHRNQNRTTSGRAGPEGHGRRSQHPYRRLP
jgi:hypothetical protein